MPRKQQPRVARQKTRQHDDVLLAANVSSRPRIGWMASIRQAFGMSKTQLARRIDVARQSLDDLESTELKGTITLASMRNVAEALGCDLQYAFVPRKPLEKMIAEQTLRRASKKLGRVAMDYNREWEARGDAKLVSFIARYHHALVLVHPFDNGNGRWSRLSCDAVVEHVAKEPPIVWATDTLAKNSD